MKKSINFLALILDVLSLLSLRGAIYSSILGAILFISCNANGQKNAWASAVPSYDTTFMLRGKNNYDTVKVAMLVCDTSNLVFNGSILVDTSGIATIRYDVHYVSGYEVRKIVVTDLWVINPKTMNGEYEWYYEHIAYLDENKKPLSKNIIVWQTK